MSLPDNFEDEAVDDGSAKGKFVEVDIQDDLTEIANG